MKSEAARLHPEQPGTVWIVGAGPGDAELLTLKALRALESADIVLYDRLVGVGVLKLIPDRTERVFVGKSHGEQEGIQTEIMRLLVQHARTGKTVVRLKGGDPFVFGRGAEEWAWLHRHGIPVQIVPGISSSVAVPALAGVPLTYRGVARHYAVLTGHRAVIGDSSPENWQLWSGVDTLVILMGVGERCEIAARLIAAGRADTTPCAFIERGSTPSERVVVSTLGLVAAGRVEISAPAVWVIGAVVNLRQHLISQ